MEDEDIRKEVYSRIFKCAFEQMTVGCGRQICFNPYCFNNPHALFRRPNDVAAFLISHMKFEDPNSFIVFCSAPVVEVSEDEALAFNVQELFSNVELLGKSFMLGEISPDNPALDFERINRAYKVIDSKIKSDELENCWINSCIAWLNLNQYSQLYLPRAALVLLVNRAFLDPMTNEALSKLLELLTESVSHMRSIGKWLDAYPEEELMHLNYLLQQFITINLCDLSSSGIVNDVMRGVKLLELVFTSNLRVQRLTKSDFYNDAVNKEVDLRHQYDIWMRFNGQQFSFIDYSWILDAASKATLLQLESLQQMNFQGQQSLLANAASGLGPPPYFILQIRREHLLEDALSQLGNGSVNFRKQLKVRFVGEEGVDAGGLKKEFFQLIVRELFDPVFSMFLYCEDSKTYWFNPDTLETNANFKLVGTVLRLAIYNGVILDVHLPLTAYKKLMGVSVGLKDLEQVNPGLAAGLKQMLCFEGNIEATYCRHFCVETEGFGMVNQHELVEGGRERPVTNENVKEYVKLYVNWILNQGIQAQFNAFYQGFWNICGGQVMQLFSSEELELMVCGNPKLDFYELQRTTRYDGYAVDTPIIKELWTVLHSLVEEQKKKFLFFVTGSDRAPINGLSSLELTIIRNGPDSDRLMTASTCFNMLLLPEYTCGGKLNKLLLLAISNSEGFGLR